MPVPFRFKNAKPPVSEFDIDAEKINANYDSLSNGSGVNDKAIKDKHIDETSLLITYYVKRFIVSADLILNPVRDLGLSNGDVVALNDISSDGGKLYKVVLGNWSLYKNRRLHITIVNNDDNHKYRLVLNTSLEYVWVYDSVINDLDVSLVNTWSAEKIVNYVTTSLSNATWVNPVLSQTYSSPPGVPSVGDRYIVKAIGSGNWVGKDNQIAEYSPTGWFFYPLRGFVLKVLDENKFYHYYSGTWTLFEKFLGKTEPITEYPTPTAGSPNLTLAHIPIANSDIVFWNKSVQKRGADPVGQYSITGNILTFTWNLDGTEEIIISYSYYPL